MKTMKRALAVLLAAVLLCVGVPLAAQAEGLAPTGSCGESVTWSFDADTGSLTISGEGAMMDYDDGSPFHNHEEIKTVIIYDGVTSIGNWAFPYCVNLEEITIPNSMIVIGEYAFFGCKSLEAITIPSNVASIGTGTFFLCDSLKSISVDNNNSNFSSDENGCLYNKRKTVLIRYPSGTDKTFFSVPDSVNDIWNGAFFGCSYLKSIMIPNGVTSIKEGVFYYCSSLESIIIPKSVTAIAMLAFANCSSLTSVTINESVSSISEYAFGECTNLTDVYYCGTSESWDALIIDEGNEPLQNATLHFHDYQPTYEWSADNSTVTASLVCTRCDDVQAKETVGTVCKTVEATCMNPGLLTYTSEGFANKAFYVQTKTIEIAQKPHMTTQIREVSPTCDREGVGSYWTCSTCDGIFEDEAATRPLTEPPVLPKLPHTPGEPVTENETAATCTAEGSYDTVVYCFACGQELSRETTETPVLDHTDADNDGHCDACGAQMQGGDHCKVCGKIHNGGFFDKLTGFFHKIIGIFKR